MKFTEDRPEETLHIYSYGTGNKDDIRIIITHCDPLSAVKDYSSVCISLDQIPSFMNILNSVIKKAKERIWDREKLNSENLKEILNGQVNQQGVKRCQQREKEKSTKGHQSAKKS